MYDYTVESFTARCLELGRELGNIFTKPGVCNYCCDFFTCFGICIKVGLYESSSIKLTWLDPLLLLGLPTQAGMLTLGKYN